MSIWFTSDQHFWHKNVIEYCKRPFLSLEEMHRTLIQRHRALVKETDTIYFLGDFCFGGTTKVKEILAQLSGKKVLVMGNHDIQNRAHKWAELGFDLVSEPGAPNQINEFNLSHFPYKGTEPEKDRPFEWQLKDDGRWLLHGHVHQHWKVKGRQINCGVDVWDFWPVNLKALEALRDKTA